MRIFNKEDGSLVKKYNQQKELIQLLKKVTSTTISYSSFDEIIEETLRLICLHTSWVIGHAYYADRREGEEGCAVLLPTKFWYLERPEKYKELKQLIEKEIVKDCAGLVGKVYISRQANWNSGEYLGFETLEIGTKAKSLGLKSAFAFPIKLKGKVVAILQFLSNDDSEADSEFLELMEHIGNLLGYLMESKFSETALRESEARFRSLFESALDAIIIFDERGFIIEANSSALSLFGYTKEEIFGKKFTKLFPACNLDEIKSSISLDYMRAEGITKNLDKLILSISLAHWQSGLSVFYCAIMRRDITFYEKGS